MSILGGLAVGAAAEGEHPAVGVDDVGVGVAVAPARRRRARWLYCLASFGLLHRLGQQVGNVVCNAPCGSETPFQATSDKASRLPVDAGRLPALFLPAPDSTRRQTAAPAKRSPGVNACSLSRSGWLASNRTGPIGRVNMQLYGQQPPIVLPGVDASVQAAFKASSYPSNSPNVRNTVVAAGMSLA